MFLDPRISNICNYAEAYMINVRRELSAGLTQNAYAVINLYVTNYTKYVIQLCYEVLLHMILIDIWSSMASILGGHFN